MQCIKIETIEKFIKIRRSYNKKTFLMELYLLHNCFVKEKRNRLYRHVILHIPKIQFTRLRNGCKLDTKWIIIKF
jgi:hypothetical protein